MRCYVMNFRMISGEMKPLQNWVGTPFDAVECPDGRS